MIENQDHFKFFIEDDQSFDDYIKDMSKDGSWGGNLEIYALSMRFNVNFYIHIYNHPMYIVKNFTEPLRNVQLSYHDGEHYNSVRLKDDFTEDIPIQIPLEMINCVEVTTNMNALAELDNNTTNDNEDEEDEDEETKDTHTKSDYYSNKNDMYDYEDENEKDSEKTEKINSDDIIINGTTVKDFSEKQKKTDKFRKSILTQEGNILDEIKDFSKCHCDTNKKYKNCCSTQDIKGEYDKDENVFYTDKEIFKSRFHYEIKSKESKENKSNGNNEVGTVTKHMERIFI